MKSSGLGDTAYFGPEPEFFVFDRRAAGSNDMSGCFVKIDSEEAAVEHRQASFEGGNMGHRPAVKGGYFPVPPLDSFQDMRSEMCLILESVGIPVEVHHHEVANAGPELETRHQVQHADPARRLECSCRSTSSTTWPMPMARRPPSCPSPSSATTAAACTCTRAVWKDGKNLFAGDGYAGLERTSRCTTSAASSSTPVR